MIISKLFQNHRPRISSEAVERGFLYEQQLRRTKTKNMIEKVKRTMTFTNVKDESMLAKDTQINRVNSSSTNRGNGTFRSSLRTTSFISEIGRSCFVFENSQVKTIILNIFANPQYKKAVSVPGVWNDDDDHSESNAGDDDDILSVASMSEYDQQIYSEEYGIKNLFSHY